MRRAFQLVEQTDDFMSRHPQMFDDPRTLQGVNQLDWFNYGRQTPATEFTQEDLLRTWASRLRLTTVEANNFILGRTTNWQNEVFQPGFQQDYHLSASNRTDDVSYFWSVGYSDREGVRVGDRFQRVATRLNLESTITPFLKVGLNSGFSSRNDGFFEVETGAQTSLSPFAVNEIGNPDVPWNVQRHPAEHPTGTNPLFDRQYRTRRDRLNTLNANAFAIVTLPLGIEYQFNFTPYYQRRDWMDHESAQNPQWAGTNGRAERRTYETYSWQIDNILRWSKRINEIHNFEATFLQNAEKRQRWEHRLIGRNFSPSDILGYHRMQAATLQEFNSNDDYLTGDALMGRVFYSLMDRYMLTTSVRRDGYSAFGLNNPHAVFFAVAGAWTFTSEKFAESFNHIMDFGKLRFSWGENGNRDIGQYAALANLVSDPHPYMQPGGNYFLLQQTRADRMANSNLRWERTASTNIGLDFALFNSLLSGSMEAYIATTINLLMQRELPNVLGYDNVMANLGKIENKGFEMSLTARVMRNQNFTWNTSGNFSLNRRKIISLHGNMIDIYDDNGIIIGKREANDYTNEWFIGQDPDRIWDYKQDGVWQVGETEDTRAGWRPGDFKYIDQNGDGILNNDDKVFQGYRTPRFSWAWRNDFTIYKNFTLTTSVYSAMGQYRRFNEAANNPSFPDRESQFAQPYWTPENGRNDFARLRSANLGNNWVKSSFVRFDNIALSYNVPRSIVQKASIQNMRITAGVRNVAVWSPHWKWWDPEAITNTGGSTYSPRTYNVSLNFTL
jgi:TonB-linked SusC/RagA family outer membrane protein